MLKRLVIGTAATVLTGALALPAMAQKPGGILRIYHRDSPASMSVHEEGTIGVIMPMMGVFNNLVMFDQNVPQNSDKSIVPDLATSWAWNEDHTALTFKLRDGVKWHDGKPFTADDVKCTFDLLTNQGKEKLRLNYRESWWVNLQGDDGQRPRRGDAASEKAAAGPAGAARLGRHADLPVPCRAGADAAAPDRHGSVQIRRVQAEPGHQARQEPGLLEAGPALSRRHRVHDRPEPLDGDPRLYRRQVRHDLSLRGHVPAAEGHQEPGAAVGLPGRRGERVGRHSDEPDQAALRQSPTCARRWR